MTTLTYTWACLHPACDAGGEGLDGAVANRQAEKHTKDTLHSTHCGATTEKETTS